MISITEFAVVRDQLERDTGADNESHEPENTGSVEPAVRPNRSMKLDGGKYYVTEDQE